MPMLPEPMLLAEQLPGVLIVGLVVVGLTIAILAVIYEERARRRRREALLALAASLGLSFDPGDDPSHDKRYPQFAVFSRGHTRRAYNTISGLLEIDGRSFRLRMGDYTYKITTSNGKTTTTTTYRFSYIILGVPFDEVPALRIRREHFFDRVAGALGFDDIDFESAEFSRRFHVSSPDRRFAYDVISPRMMEFLMTGDPPSIELEGGSLCATDGQRRWEPEEFRSTLAWTARFFDLWPDFLTRRLDGPERVTPGEAG